VDSISSFAEKLILEEIENVKKGKAFPPSTKRNQPSMPSNVRDISEVEIPDSFMREVLGEEHVPFSGFDVVKEEEVSTELIEPTSDQSELPLLTEDTAYELMSLLRDVKHLLVEMTAATTTTGQIGVNLAGSSQSKRKSKKLQRDKLGYLTIRHNLKKRRKR
jgi:hypothetical protein